MKKIVFYFLFLVFSYNISLSQNTIIFSGKILDERSKPVANASVYLLNTNVSVLSDSIGNFVLNHISSGRYSIAISAIGYATISESVNINAANESHSFRLNDAFKQLDVVVVSAQKKRREPTTCPTQYFGVDCKKY